MQVVCQRYWPTTDVELYGEYIITRLEEQKRDSYVERVLSITDSKVNQQLLSSSSSLQYIHEKSTPVYLYTSIPSLWMKEVLLLLIHRNSHTFTFSVR